MRHWKRQLGAAALCGAVLLAGAPTAGALDHVSEWAVEELRLTEENGLVPQGLLNLDMRQNVTRQEFCAVALSAYERLSGPLPENQTSGVFADTDDPQVNLAYQLGIVLGREEGRFDPDAPITRQEMFTMLHNLLGAVDRAPAYTADQAAQALAAFQDGGQVASWAQIPCSIMLDLGVTKGAGAGTLSPRAATSREQALIMAYRFWSQVRELPEQAPVNFAFDLDSPTGNGPVVLYFYGDGFDRCQVAVRRSQSGEAIFTADTTEDAYAIPASVTAAEGTYWIEARAYDETGRLAAAAPPQEYTALGQSLGSLHESYEDKYARIFGAYDAPLYQTAEEAESHMVTITVDVWNLDQGGNKVPAKRSLKVHEAIAPTVERIFAEIYAGPEQFPIRDLGGYAWRQGNSKSEHKWGIAIDINPTENMQIKNGQVLAGEFWTPGDNPYSIPMDGDVVRAFEKYGFAWGGTAWQSNQDYMHFSYLGN